jgi:hypothetical protein
MSGARDHWQAKPAAAAPPYTHAKTTRSCLTKPTEDIIKLADCQNIEQHIKHTTHQDNEITVVSQ